MGARILFEFSLPIVFRKKGKWVVVSCPVLDIHSQGENEEIARENIIEAIQLFLETCFENGTLDSVLKECGFKLDNEPIKKSTKRPNNYVNIPIPLLAKCQYSY